MVGMTLIQPLIKGQVHSFFVPIDLIAYMRLPVSCQ